MGLTALSGFYLLQLCWICFANLHEVKTLQMWNLNGKSSGSSERKYGQNIVIMILLLSSLSYNLRNGYYAFM